MKPSFFTLLVIAMLALLISQSSESALVELNDPVLGTNAITQDTDTGLEWLDLTFSLNLSYNYVSNQFGVSRDFEGFRHAAASEVESLFEAAGIPYINGSSSANIIPSQSLIGLVGATSFQDGNPQAFAITEDTTLSGTRQAGILDFFYSNGQPMYEASTTTTVYGEAFSFETVGHWLVREAEEFPPCEPGIFGLFVGVDNFTGSDEDKIAGAQDAIKLYNTLNTNLPGFHGDLLIRNMEDGGVPNEEIKEAIDYLKEEVLLPRRQAHLLCKWTRCWQRV